MSGDFSGMSVGLVGSYVSKSEIECDSSEDCASVDSAAWASE